MKDTTYTQCELRKKELVQVSWIPSEYAELFKTLDLKEDEIWSKGWVVTKVFGTKPKDVIEHQSIQYRLHRKTTDI